MSHHLDDMLSTDAARLQGAVGGGYVAERTDGVDHSDLPLLLLANSGIVGENRQVSLAASRRLVAHLLQSLRADHAEPCRPPRRWYWISSTPATDRLAHRAPDDGPMETTRAHSGGASGT